MISTMIMAVRTIRCWYILYKSRKVSAAAKEDGKGGTHCRIIFFNVPDARSIERSAFTSYRRKKGRVSVSVRSAFINFRLVDEKGDVTVSGRTVSLAPWICSLCLRKEVSISAPMSSVSSATRVLA